MQIQPDFVKVSKNEGSTEPDKKQVAQRKANFLSLCNLQYQLPPQLFEKVQENFNQGDDLPCRTGFDGSSKKCDFEELKVLSGHQNSACLPDLLRSQDGLTQKIQKFSDRKNSKKFNRNPVKADLKKCQYTHLFQKTSSLPYILNFKNRNTLVKQIAQNQLIKSKEKLVKTHLENNDRQQFKRMKTVFGHANINEGTAVAVYNVKFDQEDKFIISGADDGIIKVWSKDTLILQASLHGHQDMIIDIAISKCNRFFASGSKDGHLIIWDLKLCKIIKILESDHTSQINGIQFIMMERKQKKTMKSTEAQEKESQSDAQRNSIFINDRKPEDDLQYDQFLVTCSDDGSINIYDVSSFTKYGVEEYYIKQKLGSCVLFLPTSKLQQTREKNQKIVDKNQILNGIKNAQVIEENDQEDKITRRTRKKQLLTNQGQTNTNATTANSSSQSQQDLDIFMVKLRPDDFRQGSKNKHIDACSVNSRGLLVGGTNHGEVFMWQVNFHSIRSRKSDSHPKWIGSFKLHKKANHYLRFSPSGDMLLTGSADGTASIWDTSFLEKKNKISFDDFKNDIFEPSKPSYLSHKEIELTDEQHLFTFKEPDDPMNFLGTECLIDGIEWSKNGRYAFCAISVKQKAAEKEEGQPSQANIDKQAVVKVKVYDTLDKRCIENLDNACRLGKEMVNYSSVLKAHPKDEDILLSCFDGGMTILYNIRTQEIVQQIEEHGIYSIEQFAMNNAVDVDFTSDGHYIAFTSIFGTLSLYSTRSHLQSHYAGTRVQQFFTYDNAKHEYNPFERQQQHPKLCGFELNPYEVQPIGPQIGMFKKPLPQSQQEIEEAHIEFERQQIFAIEFASEEEIFYQDQLKDGLRQGLFNNSNSSNIDRQQSSAMRPQQIVRLISSVERPQPNPLGNAHGDIHEDSDLEVLQPNRRRGHSIQRQDRRLVRTNNEPDNVDESADAEMDDSDEDFGSDGEDSNCDDDDSLDSETGLARVHGTNHGLIKRIDRDQSQRRQQYHDFELNDDMSDSQEVSQSQRPQRPRKRNQEESKRSNNFVNLQENQRNSRTRRRLRQVVHSGETSQFVDPPDDESNFGDTPMNQRTRRRGIRNIGAIGLDSREASCEDYDSEEEEIQRGREKRVTRHSKNSGRGRLRRNSRNTNQDDEDEDMSDDNQKNGGRPTRRAKAQALEQIIEPSELSTSQRNTRTRVNRIQPLNDQGRKNGRRRQRLNSDSNIDFNDNFSADDNDDPSELGTMTKSKLHKDNQYDQKYEKLITEFVTKSKPDLERDDTFSQRGSKTKKGAVIIKEGKMLTAESSKFKEIIDEDYKLSTDPNIKCQRICHFCKRSMDNHQLIGPFVKDKTAKQILESQDSFARIEESNEGIFFHQKCLESNNFVRYDTTNQKWLNIGVAIQQLIEHKQFSCYRCILKGATVQCSTCERSFHGHFCQNQYMLPTDEQSLSFMCMFCRNSDNYHLFKKDTEKEFEQFRKNELDTIRKNIDKKQILETKPCQIDNFYVPQLKDEVIYFYQGHENFMQSNNCYFYSGIQKQMGSTDLPWMRIPQLKNQPYGFVHCMVKSMSHKFSSLNTANLVEKFGDCSSDITQKHQIISYVELEIIDTSIKNLKVKRFMVPIFPSEASQFIIPIQLFNHKLALFEKCQQEGNLIGKRFKTYKAKQMFAGRDIKVGKISSLEPEVCNESHWESILVNEVETSSMMRNDRGRRGATYADDISQAHRISFWDIIYPQETQISLSDTITQILPKAFDYQEQKRLEDALSMLIQKKYETCQLFHERVDEKIAYDYKSFVSAEMWLDLILERLRNAYYRSQDQFWFDFDLIILCSKTYNGPEDDLTDHAEGMVEYIRKNLRSYINVNKEGEHTTKLKPYTFKGNKDNSFEFGLATPENSKQNSNLKESGKNSTKISDILHQNSFGIGGQSVKNHLKTSLESEALGQALHMEMNCKIVLELSETEKQDLEKAKGKKSRGSKDVSIQNISSNGATTAQKDCDFIKPKRRGRPKKNKVVDENGLNLSFDQRISSEPQLSDSLEFTVKLDQGIITIDKSKSAVQSLLKEKEPIKLGKRKRADNEDSSQHHLNSQDQNSNVENSMSHNVDLSNMRKMTRYSKRQKIEL